MPFWRRTDVEITKQLKMYRNGSFQVLTDGMTAKHVIRDQNGNLKKLKYHSDKNNKNIIDYRSNDTEVFNNVHV